jgi:hypothetical protein
VEEAGAVARRNLTLQLDQETIRQAKIVAAKRGTSISGLVARELELMVARSARYVEAARQAGATRVVTETSSQAGSSAV